ncbi:restriction endonuclease [Mucilaginibacter aquaedulcis]|uniref:restriction endonuclease n=1 Tax=Mucilaginibacter aquaedulcis TaxID=1187081 RepID=UPI0025B4247E|nr:restriction endonuclease [Mucilaginibacter aquaedulcis]MDN3551009.1 restriction endonuclease [Mucilaginibacter aquaedulcis]
MDNKLTPTKTTNRLHFSDLDSSRFEEICYMLLSYMFKWKKLDHIGKTGSDGGIDIRGISNGPKGDKLWAIQCKRYVKVTGNELQAMVDKILENNAFPDKILLIFSCDLSKKRHDEIEKYCSTLKLHELEIWTATTLETHLYANPKVLSIAFGINKESETKMSIAKLNRGLKMKERLAKAIIDHKFLNNPKNRATLIGDPSSKFVSEDVYIRAINDNTYGTGETTPKGLFNTSFRTFFYNTYHNGLEFWLSPGIGIDIIMDENGYWEPIWNSADYRLKNKEYKVIPVKAIGRIAYHSIINFIKDGDEFTSCPHLFCLFDGEDGMPYEEIYFKYQGNAKRGSFDWNVDKRKRTIFPSDD